MGVFIAYNWGNLIHTGFRDDSPSLFSLVYSYYYAGVRGLSLRRLFFVYRPNEYKSCFCRMIALWSCGYFFRSERRGNYGRH